MPRSDTFGHQNDYERSVRAIWRYNANINAPGLADRTLKGWWQQEHLTPRHTKVTRKIPSAYSTPYEDVEAYLDLCQLQISQFIDSKGLKCSMEE